MEISSFNLTDRWKKQILNQQSPLAGAREQWVWQLEVEQRRVQREWEVLKNFEPFRLAPIVDVFIAVEQIAICSGVALSSICDVLSVSCPGFYAWQNPDLSARDCRDRQLMPLTRKTFRTHPRRYGAHPIAMELASVDERCGVARVAKLLERQACERLSNQHLKACPA